jgi:predicted GNAT family N-acyltransferase
MEDKESIKEVELAKRGVDAFVDRANELHHQGRHIDALKQLERARRICEKKLGPLHTSTIKVHFILSSMRDADGSLRGPTDMNLHFVYFESNSNDANRPGCFELARILRRRIFVEELGVCTQAEFDEHDIVSRHVLGLLGDAPVSYARWRLDGDIAVIDRLCTLNRYRQRSVARKCLENVIQDISQFCAELKLVIKGLIILVPKHARILQHKLSEANFLPLAECATHHIPSIQMWLPAKKTGTNSLE